MFKNKKLIIAICIVLIAVTALLALGKKYLMSPESGETSAKHFTFVVTDLDKSEKSFNLSSTKTKVGDALTDNGLISGDNGPYGLYVKTVDGVTYDYDTDGVYWSFYINGEMAMSGVDTTDIVDGSIYEFKAEK